MSSAIVFVVVQKERKKRNWWKDTAHKTESRSSSQKHKFIWKHNAQQRISRFNDIVFIINLWLEFRIHQLEFGWGKKKDLNTAVKNGLYFIIYLILFVGSLSQVIGDSKIVFFSSACFLFQNISWRWKFKKYEILPRSCNDLNGGIMFWC